MSCRPTSAAPAPATAISKAARARTAARTSSARSWPPPPPSPAILSTSDHSTTFPPTSDCPAVREVPMRVLTVAVLLFGVVRITAMTAGDDTAQRAAIQAVLDAHGTAWTKGDAVAAAAVMTEDADWVSGDGSIYEGLFSIYGAHREWLTGDAKGSRHAHPGRPEIRFIRPDV